ncbi:unknown [Ligilactobacillus ruminis CAG:367]|nr:unknown [Ligilactobacillus ruminis CAG:367]
MSNSPSFVVPVFPVYAGVIPKTGAKFATGLGVPRVCGGDPVDGFYPLKDTLVFPVYAGVILIRLIYA